MGNIIILILSIVVVFGSVMLVRDVYIKCCNHPASGNIFLGRNAGKHLTGETGQLHIVLDGSELKAEITQHEYDVLKKVLSRAFFCKVDK